MIVSIIICTCNRVADLRRTLESIGHIAVPQQLSTELVVVDNASTDDTPNMTQSYQLPNMPVRYIHEPRRGKGFAYNSGMAAALGDIFLFTDDDVRLPHNWIAAMCTPIMDGNANAVTGGVNIAPHLVRDWMTPRLRGYLAATDVYDPQAPEAMVGANMAFSKTVLDRVPSFDVELGPGALGFGDETLFSQQLKCAGYRIMSAFDVCVEHHFDSKRLERKNLLKMVQKMGHVRAYIEYHWEHHSYKATKLLFLRTSLQLLVKRLQKRHQITTEGLMDWEIDLVHDIAFFDQYAKENKRRHNYNKHGLIKVSGL